jgi:hypothetical protein
MGELVARFNMHDTFFSQSAVVNMADLHMSNSPDLNQAGCLRSLVERRTGFRFSISSVYWDVWWTTSQPYWWEIKCRWWGRSSFDRHCWQCRWIWICRKRFTTDNRWWNCTRRHSWHGYVSVYRNFCCMVVSVWVFQFLNFLSIGLLSNFLGAGVGTSLMYPIGNNKLRWSVHTRPSL